jgi:hypothetical protein
MDCPEWRTLPGAAGRVFHACCSIDYPDSPGADFAERGDQRTIRGMERFFMGSGHCGHGTCRANRTSGTGGG